MTSTINVIKKQEVKDMIIERCGEDPISDGIQCPHCGCDEAFKDKNDPDNTNKWFWMVSAFKVDDHSHCRNCDRWFGLH